MSENGTASSNTGQTVTVRKEERNVSEDVTDDTDVTASTRVPLSEGGLCPYHTKPAFQLVDPRRFFKNDFLLTPSAYPPLLALL